MKDTLLIYYSLEGNTQFVAETAAQALEMDVERLKPSEEPPKKGPGKFLKGGGSVVMKKTPELAPLTCNAENYKNIIIAYPVWAGSYAPAIASFVKDHKPSGKKIYMIGCSASGNAQKSFDRLTEALEGNEICGTLSLTNPAKDKEKNAALIKEFVGRIAA